MHIDQRQCIFAKLPVNQYRKWEIDKDQQPARCANSSSRISAPRMILDTK